MATINVNNIRGRGLFPRQDSSLQRDDEDNVYYNIRITNVSNERIQARFSENRVVPVLDKPDDYELAVVRFKVPAQSIPIFLWDGTPPYYITLSYDGVDVSKQLQYIGDYSPEQDAELYGRAIWSYQSVADIINIALKDAFDELKILKPLAPPTTPPVMSYDGATNLYTISAEQLYDDSTNTIGLYANYDIFTNIGGFQWSSDTPYIQPPSNPLKYKRLRIKNNFTNKTTINGNPWYVFQQEYQSLALLNDITSIAFETDSIPIEPEYLPSQKNETRRLMTDFEPIDTINDQISFQFFPQGPLRYFDLKSAYPLNRIDLRIYWINRLGRELPVYINRGDVLTVKLQFRKKVDRVLRRLAYAEGENDQV